MRAERRLLLILVAVLVPTWASAQAMKDPASRGFVHITDGVNSATVTSDGALKVDGSTVTQPVSGPLTDTQLRATPLPVSGTVTVGSFPDNEPINLAQVGGTAVVTGGVVGSQAIGGTAANNAIINQNPVLLGAETLSTQPAAAATGNQRRLVASLDGGLFVNLGGPVRWSCFVQAVTATTQCRAAPASGLRAYVTSIALSNLAATVQTLDLVFGTGTNCATGTTALTHKFQMGTNATTTSPFVIVYAPPTPLVPTAANAICVRPSAATSFGATLTGYDAP